MYLPSGEKDTADTVVLNVMWWRIVALRKCTRRALPSVEMLDYLPLTSSGPTLVYRYQQLAIRRESDTGDVLSILEGQSPRLIAEQNELVLE